MVWGNISRWIGAAATDGLKFHQLGLCAALGLVLAYPHTTLLAVYALMGLPHIAMTLLGLAVLLVLPALVLLSLARPSKYSPANLVSLWLGLFFVHAGYSFAVSRSGDVFTTMGGENIPWHEALVSPVTSLAWFISQLARQ